MIAFSSVSRRAGKHYIGLANDNASFSGSSCCRIGVEVPASGNVSIRFSGLPTGQYAIRVFQDLNESQQLNRPFSLPTELHDFST